MFILFGDIFFALMFNSFSLNGNCFFSKVKKIMLKMNIILFWNNILFKKNLFGWMEFQIYNEVIWEYYCSCYLFFIGNGSLRRKWRILCPAQNIWISCVFRELVIKFFLLFFCVIGSVIEGSNPSPIFFYPSTKKLRKNILLRTVYEKKIRFWKVF